MGGMFSYAKSFNQNINDWNVSNVINMGRYNGIFSGKICDTGELNDKYEHYESINSAWELEFVIDDSGMFGEAVSFNQPLDKWNVSSVINMEQMFACAESFNKPLNSWDTSSVRDMACMFFGALSFNQPLDKWNVSSVINMEQMFEGAKSFNQNLDSWSVDSLCSSVQDYEFRGSAMENNLPKWCKK